MGDMIGWWVGCHVILEVSSPAIRRIREPIDSGVELETQTEG